MKGPYSSETHNLESDPLLANQQLQHYSSIMSTHGGGAGGNSLDTDFASLYTQSSHDSTPLHQTQFSELCFSPSPFKPPAAASTQSHRHTNSRFSTSVMHNGNTNNSTNASTGPATSMFSEAPRSANTAEFCQGEPNLPQCISHLNQVSLNHRTLKYTLFL